MLSSLPIVETKGDFIFLEFADFFPHYSTDSMYLHTRDYRLSYHSCVETLFPVNELKIIFLRLGQ